MIWRRIAAAIIALAVLAAGGALLYGRENLWRLIGGPADQGAVDFAELSRPSKPNYFLLCPRNLCASAEPDAIAPVYAVTAARLREAALATWQLGDDVEGNRTDANKMQLRYVMRSALLRFPDTVSIRFVAVSDNTATLAIFSRSLIGYSDFGANRSRVERWLEALNLVPEAK